MTVSNKVQGLRKSGLRATGFPVLLYQQIVHIQFIDISTGDVDTVSESAIHKQRAIEAYLPVKAKVLSILLALAEGPQHGYGVIERVRESDQSRSMHTAPFYRHLRRLLDDGLVRQLDKPPRGGRSDTRRGPYYALTRFGKAVAAAECARLKGLVALGRRLGLESRKT